MFERDKDDLRSLGITIELGTFDPLFEDEAGYRIKPESYALQLQNLNSSQVALLSKASQLWREATFAAPAQSGLRKLKSIGIESDFDAIAGITLSPPSTPEQLPEIFEAISERRRINFEYLDEELQPQLRSLEPYRLSHTGGHWYISGRDTGREDIRTFRLDRFASAVKFSSPANAYSFADKLELPIAPITEPSVAVLRIRKGRGVQLRQAGKLISEDSDWDIYEIPYFSESYLLRQVLWSGNDVELLSPDSLRNRIIESLEAVVKLHG